MQSKQPLIDLHRHLDGNIRLSTIIDLAKQHKVSLPTFENRALAEHVYIKDKTSNLLAFLQRLDIGVSVIGSLQACERIAFENVEDAISEGLSHVELRFSPQYMAQAFELPLEGVVEAVVTGIARANAQYKYTASLIGILSRTYGQGACMLELNALLAYKEHLCGIDLAGDEQGYPAKLFIPHFERVQQAGLNATIHAGEASGSHSIWDAINCLHANRIGHGVAAHTDVKLMQYMANNNIGIESCILSNYQTGTWTNMASHPVKTFLEYNIPVCLNTDDPGISNNTLVSEYTLASSEIGLNEVQLQRLKANALSMAFLSKQKKDAILASL